MPTFAMIQAPEPRHVKDQHRTTACGAGNPVADLLRFRTRQQNRSLPPFDGLNVLFQR